MENNNSLPILEEKKDIVHSIIGWVLLGIALILLFIFQWLPIINTFILSFQESNLLGGNQFIGLTNYTRMFADEGFWTSLLNTFRTSFFSLNIFYFVIAPLALAFLLIKLKPTGEIILRIISSLLIFACSSILVSLIGSWFFNPNFGLFNQLILSLGFAEPLAVFANPDTVIFGLQFIELAYGLGLAIPLGLVLYLAALKGATLTFIQKPVLKNIWSNTWRILLIMLIIIFALTLQNFTSVFLTTGGGPANSSSIIMFKIYREAFQMMRFGYASAQQVIIIILLLLAGVALWLILEKSGIKIWINNKTAKKGESLKSQAFTIILVLSLVVIFFTVIIVVFWLIVPGLGAFSASFQDVMKRSSPDNYAIAATQFELGKSYANSFVIIIPSLILQLGISFAAGLALGRFRFAGRKVIFFIICLTAFITPQIISPQLYMQMHGLGLLNTFLALIIPRLACPLGIILFKLYFEGVRIDLAYINMEQEQQAKSAIMRKIIMNTVFMSVFVMFILLLFHINDLLFPIAMIFNPQLYTLNIANAFLMGGFQTMNWNHILAHVFLSSVPVILTGALLLILQGLFLPRMNIIRTK